MPQDSTNNLSAGTENAVPTQNAIDQINKKVEELRTLEKKNYRINRVRMLCSILCLLLVTAMIVLLLMNVNVLMSKAQQITNTVSNAGKQFEQVAGDIDVVVADLEQVDFAKLGNTLQEIADISKDTIEQVNDSAGDLDKIVQTAETVLDNLSSIKIDYLNKGIDDLNRVLESIKAFFSKMPF